jgi:hypothetical protein
MALHLCHTESTAGLHHTIYLQQLDDKGAAQSQTYQYILGYPAIARLSSCKGWAIFGIKTRARAPHFDLNIFHNRSGSKALHGRVLEMSKLELGRTSDRRCRAVGSFADRTRSLGVETAIVVLCFNSRIRVSRLRISARTSSTAVSRFSTSS